MALRNQPYMPLYVQDFLTDEKLIECSAEATGVYIRLMCIMHKSEEYGTVLLKQKDKQTESKCYDFACKLAKHMPYEVKVVFEALEELLNEGVLLINDDKLLQKRMIKDNDISIKRSNAGQKGGFATANKPANVVANSEYENEVVVECKDKAFKNKVFRKPTIEEIKSYCDERKNGINPKHFFDSNEMKGWVVGKNQTPMKDWKACIRTWENNGINKPQPKMSYHIESDTVTEETQMSDEERAKFREGLKRLTEKIG